MTELPEALAVSRGICVTRERSSYAGPHTCSSHIRKGSGDYTRRSLALFCAGFANLASLYCVQLLLPLLAERCGLSSASSALALSLATLSLATSLLVWGRWGRKPVMRVAPALAVLVDLLLVRTQPGISLSVCSVQWPRAATA